MGTNNLQITAHPTTTAASIYPQPTNPHLQGTTTNHLGKSIGSLTENLYTHLRTGGPSGALSRLAHGTKILTQGGFDRIFNQLFPALPGEKLDSAYACYLSTNSGPIMGTLYVSNRRVAFSSDQPVKVANTMGGNNNNNHYFTTGVSRCYYKVVVMVEEMVAVNASATVMTPPEKYVQVVARDGHEFWFMGFIFYDNAFKDLRNAMQHRAPPPAPVVAGQFYYI